jgi:hypothetical protein
MTEPVAASSVEQIGVGTLPPGGKVIFTVSALPEMVPANVPVLALWHEPHVPSFGFTGLISALPERSDPDCEIASVTSSGLNESEPVPDQMPTALPLPVGVAIGGGAEVDDAVGVNEGATGPDADPQPARHIAAAPSHAKGIVFMVIQGSV